MANGNPTANDIVQQVERLLATKGGQSKIRQLNGHFARIADCKDELAVLRRRIHPRPNATFYVTVGTAKATRLEVDVRIRGISCGRVWISPKSTRRRFEPKGDHRQLFKGSPAPWEDKRVQQYLEEVGRKLQFDGKEAEVEAALLLQLARTSSATKQEALLWHQPVKLAKLPFQFPLPISARGEPKVPDGNSAGHADVVARARLAGHERLRVFEVKQSNAKDIGHALDQAVAYCAALDHLVKHYPQAYYSALGYGRPRNALLLDAVAFVPDSKANRRLVQAAAKRLAVGGSPFGLSGMYFTCGKHGLEVQEDGRY